jgi:hypothetical protein
VFSTMHQPTVESELPLRSWLLPYDRRTIVTPLDETAVRAQLTAYLDRLHALRNHSRFSGDLRRYKGTLVGDTLSLSGSSKDRGGVLLYTRGVIRTASDGTAIELTLCLSRAHNVMLLGWLAFVWSVGLIIGYPLVLLLLGSGVVHFIFVQSFRSEVAYIVRQLLAVVGPQRQPGELVTIVPDRIGWRCGACGGYVREDASFCKHCKQSFNP